MESPLWWWWKHSVKTSAKYFLILSWYQRTLFTYAGANGLIAWMLFKFICACGSSVIIITFLCFEVFSCSVCIVLFFCVLIFVRGAQVAVRQPHKSIATYATQLKWLAEHCNFGDNDCLNEMIWDRLVCGIVNEKWQQRLLAEDKLTYDKAYKLLLSLEASEKQVKDLTRSEATCVHQLRPSRQSSTPTPATKGKPPRKPIPKDIAKPCYRCGGEHNSD